MSEMTEPLMILSSFVRNPRNVALASIALFFSACFFHSMGTCGGMSFFSTIPPEKVVWFDNINVVFFGWAAALLGQFGWFANIPWIANLFRLSSKQKPRSAMVVAEGLFVVAAFAPVSLAHSEASLSGPICLSGLGLGFWLWVASHLIVILGRSSGDFPEPPLYGFTAP